MYIYIIIYNILYYKKELESGVKASHPLISEYYKNTNILYIILESEVKVFVLLQKYIHIVYYMYIICYNIIIYILINIY